MGVSFKLLQSSYLVRKTRGFSITANITVLFLLWVMKSFMLVCLMTVVPKCIERPV